ncbi:pancreatic triacylglycerol lipase-like isoform X1 [Euwallacea fornicatus]|uniref:pancreatic triacylglycerol lipase-like isoform X1 n=1 Tax=Euwallacea fornicatus TaxID=995702 RepID=UPI00338F6B04
MCEMEGQFFVLAFLGALMEYVYSQAPPGPIVYQHQIPNRLQRTISFGACRIVINPQCPDPDVTFWMYTMTHPENPEQIFAATHVRGTNLDRTTFNASRPTKVIVHGYNSNMFLTALAALRKEYLKTNDCNVFFVDWSPLNQSPCYPGAVWNARHVGVCTAQLVERIKDMGATDIHIIGFSLGAHITNYLSLALRPYRLPRITGLDPALPGYIKAGNDDKLDKTDAEFVDVYHTSAFMQGKAEESGHVDFYFNGGSIQPGCWETDNFFSCNHHRAPLYYAESINSRVGFWGWKCESFVQYLLGGCPPNEVQIPLGERVSRYVFGTYMVITASATPFAIGPYNVSSKLLKPVKTIPEIPPDAFKLAFPIPEKPKLYIYDEDDLFKEVLKEKFPNDPRVQAQLLGNDFDLDGG